MLSIRAGHIKSRFLLMPALACDTMWFTTSAVAYLSARAVITFGEMTLDITSSALRRRNMRKCFAISSAASGLNREAPIKPATPTSRLVRAKAVTSPPLFEHFVVGIIMKCAALLASLAAFAPRSKDGGRYHPMDTTTPQCLHAQRFRRAFQLFQPMDPNSSAVERAFQLAKAGQCASINDIMRKLKSEGYIERLVGSSLIKQLKAMISASRR